MTAKMRRTRACLRQDSGSSGRIYWSFRCISRPTRKIEINGIAHSSEQNYMVRSANDLHGGRNVPRAAAKAKIDAGSEQPGGHL